MSRKKAQIWYTDFMIGVLIFVVVIVIYYAYAHNVEQDPTRISSNLLMDAKSISSSLVTGGSPEDWNTSDVEIIGITDGNQRIVQQKLDMLANMTYSQSRTKLRTDYDYYIYLEDLEGNRILIDGEQGLGKQANNSDNIVSIKRIVIYDSELTGMVVQVWD